mgnify:CR=1 FL=1
MSEKVQVKVVVSDVLKMLEEGKTRKEIKAHYNLSTAGMTKLFNSPSLKNKRTPSFVIVDDTLPVPAGVDETTDIQDLTNKSLPIEEVAPVGVSEVIPETVTSAVPEPVVTNAPEVSVVEPVVAPATNTTW